MPKLPDIEYSVQVQGPPNPMQALGSVAQGLDVLGQVTSRAQAAYAEELAKTQTAEASLIVESGLSQVESVLKAKPYLTPKEVQEALGGNVPPEIQEILGRAQDPDQPSIETYRVGAAIHAAQAKRLTEEVGPVIYNPRVKAEFGRQLEARLARRNIDVQHSMMAQGAELNAAKTISLAEARARIAETPGDWAKVYTAIESSGWLSPAQKEKYAAHFAGLQATQGKQRTAAGLAEGALSAGRDGVSPWVDAGKAQEAFEKSVEGKDPLVVEDARQRFTQAIRQNSDARKAAEDPAIARLVILSDRGYGLNRNSNDYTQLSDPGRQEVEARHVANVRSMRGERTAERSLQNRLDDEAKTAYDAKTVEEKMKLDPRKMTRKELAEALGDPEFEFASDKAVNKMIVARNKAETSWKQNSGVKQEEVVAEAKALAMTLGIFKQGEVGGGTKAKQFDAYIRNRWGDWQSSKGPDAPESPDRETVNGWIRDALEVGDKGGWHLSKNKQRYQLAPGEKLDTADFAAENEAKREELYSVRPDLRPKATTKPAVPADGKVKVRRKADGVIGRVTNPDPALYEVIP